MSSMGVHAGTQPFAPLVDDLVNDFLLHTGWTKQQSGGVALDRPEHVSASGRPFLALHPRPCNQPDLDLGCLEARVLCTVAFGEREKPQFHDHDGRCIVLLENKGVSSNAPDVWKQILRDSNSR